MKVRFILCCIFLYFLTQTNIFAQLSLLTSDSLRTKYAVPESPAFTILSVSPSNILKPVSVKELALGASNFLGENETISLPQSFGLEFSPGLVLYGKKLSLKEYQKTPWLYRLRISLATNRNEDESSASELGVGIRLTLQDDSDLRTNEKFISEATECTGAMLKVAEDIRIKLITQGIIPVTTTLQEVESRPEVTAAQDSIAAGFNKKWSIDKWSEDNWNADISEIAFAIKTTSKDSLARNLTLSKLSFWYSSAYSLSDWGQFLFGAYGNYEKDLMLDKFIGSGSIGMRFYAGTNRMKIYLETQGTIIQNKNPEWLMSSGLELKIYENIWADFTAGLKTGNESNNGVLVTDFKLKYGI